MPRLMARLQVPACCKHSRFYGAAEHVLERQALTVTVPGSLGQGQRFKRSRLMPNSHQCASQGTRFTKKAAFVLGYLSNYSCHHCWFPEHCACWAVTLEKGLPI